MEVISPTLLREVANDTVAAISPNKLKKVRYRLWRHTGPIIMTFGSDGLPSSDVALKTM